MNCCPPGTSVRQDVTIESTIGTKTKCPACAGVGVSRYVTKKTMLLMLKSEFFERISDKQYYFCANHDCQTVYFPEEEGITFDVNSLRVRVGTKAKEDPKPLCYCFGFDESDIKLEITITGKTTILGRVAELLKAGMCACEARNPSGACCLGDITKTVKRLQTEIR